MAKAKKPATKKTVAKKPVAKKPVAKKSPAKKSAAHKPVIRPATRRPDQNLPPTVERLDNITNDILFFIDNLDNYAAHLRALDRQRHNGVGLKRLGFIEAAFRISSKFPQYFPHWLNTPKFKADIELFNAVRSLVEACRSLEEKAWNVNVEAADMVYTNALEYYAQVQDASDRRIDSAETLYRELKTFFERGGYKGDEPTQEEEVRDAKAYIKGKKDGKMILENRKPKLTGGKHEVIDEKFNDKAQFKESAEGEIEE